ncbi:phosphorylase [Acidicapsa dinghuensis]|uniref:Phosphorylase n=1 Tax=Acidicapsa dinghuensis TaxID=2218256 RepID=A0ABW1EHG6_9BACT|nr:phosphorylase [Acidicapsa dinghuensis]
MTIDPRPRPIFVAALEREVAALVQNWHTDEKLQSSHIHLYWNDDAVIVCAGMGMHRASLAVEAALQFCPASELISVGWAGACNPRLHIGDVVHPTIVIDVKTGERFFISDPDSTELAEVLVTVATPASATEKERLAISYYAVAVDMEAAAVARLARAHDISFRVIKAVSDESHFEIPDMEQFATPEGQFREAAFGLHVALRPSLWSPVRNMAKSAKLAAERLQLEIRAHIEESRTRPA